MIFKKYYLNAILSLIYILSALTWCPIDSLLPAQEQNNPDKETEAVDDTYLIGPRDILSIRVFNAPELNTRTRVSGTGNITVPLLGEVYVQGLTPVQAGTKLTAMLEDKYLKNTQVSVFIEEYQSNKVSVIGAVVNPGSYELIGKETLLQLISKAGGLSERADDRVVVFRKKESTVINLDELMLKGTPNLNMVLQPGDIINVPHERFIEVYIFGQVGRPGNLRIRRSGNMTLLKAIAQAGGFTARARKGAVIVKRMIDGKEMKFKVNIKKMLKGKKTPFLLENNDVIFVPESLL